MSYDLHREHDKRDASDLAARVEADRQLMQRSRTKQHNQVKGFLFAIAGLLCVIIAILLVTLFWKNPPGVVSEQSASQPSIIILPFNPNANEKVVAFSDTHFDFDQHALSRDAKALLDMNVQGLKDYPEMNVRLAGYTSAKGTEKVNQELSEQRANTVRDYLIQEGIAPERISVVGYGRTRPALFEVTPGDSRSKEALANMRVLFEVVVK
ncbi:MAG: OmpA family protein [Bacteroidota bacterium]